MQSYCACARFCFDKKRGWGWLWMLLLGATRKWRQNEFFVASHTVDPQLRVFGQLATD